METKVVIIATLLVGSVSGMALAQDSTVTGAAGGAVTGAIVGGPVGAAVGGVVGAIAGTAIAPPPPPVVTYVERSPMPAEPVIIEERVTVGQPLPRQVILTPVPDDPAYAYAIVNNQRVIVDPNTYVVVGVVR